MYWIVLTVILIVCLLTGFAVGVAAGREWFE